MKTEGEILKGNKLIAEFMNYEKYQFGDYTMYIFGENDHRVMIDLHYHSSWDWLMPVVKKCKETDPRVYSGTHIGHYLKQFDIVGAWQEVVAFIQYYGNLK